jgi:peptide/nickel transport system permease protein
VIGGIFIRLVRVNMLQTLKADYVEAARARGIAERRVVFRHAFKNALVPVVTIVGLQFALLLSGAVLTETTFTWPGLGLSLFQFLQNRDYTAVQGLVTFYALFVVAISLLIDVVSAWVDPRIRYG